MSVLKPALRERLFWVLLPICIAITWSDSVRCRSRSQAPSKTVVEGDTEVSYPVFTEERN